MDCAATPALPAAESGRISPTLTWPVPTACGCCCGPGGSEEELNGLVKELRLCCTPEQAPSRGAPRMSPTAARRVVPPEGEWGLCGRAIGGLPLRLPEEGSADSGIMSTNS